MKRTRAVTMTEVAIVVTIIAVIAAILYPVIRGAMKKSQETRCVGNPRQIHAAIELYRAEFDGVGKYGSTYEMGMPDGLAQLYEYAKLPRSLFQCGGHATIGRARSAVYGDMFASPSPPAPPEIGDAQLPRWNDYTMEYKDRAVLLVDINHGDPGIPANSPYDLHPATGIFVGGHVERREKRGNPLERVWWLDPK